MRFKYIRAMNILRKKWRSRKMWIHRLERCEATNFRRVISCSFSKCYFSKSNQIIPREISYQWYEISRGISHFL